LSAVKILSLIFEPLDFRLAHNYMIRDFALKINFGEYRDFSGQSLIND